MESGFPYELLGAVRTLDSDLTLPAGNTKLLTALGAEEVGIGLLVLLPLHLSCLFRFLLLLRLSSPEGNEGAVLGSSLTDIRGEASPYGDADESDAERDEEVIEPWSGEYGVGEETEDSRHDEGDGELVCSVPR